MKLNEVEKIVNIVTSVATVLALVFGGVFALIEYSDYKQSEKTKNSLSFVARFKSGDILKSILNSDQIWNDSYSKLVTAMNESTSQFTYEVFVLELVQKHSLHADIGVVMGAYEEVAICVQAKLCDRKTIDTFLMKSGLAFYNTYYPFVCDQRLMWGDEAIWSNAQKYFNPDSVTRACPKQKTSTLAKST